MMYVKKRRVTKHKTLLPKEQVALKVNFKPCDLRNIQRVQTSAFDISSQNIVFGYCPQRQ